MIRKLLVLLFLFLCSLVLHERRNLRVLLNWVDEEFGDDGRSNGEIQKGMPVAFPFSPGEHEAWTEFLQFDFFHFTLFSFWTTRLSIALLVVLNTRLSSPYYSIFVT